MSSDRHDQRPERGAYATDVDHRLPANVASRRTEEVTVQAPARRAKAIIIAAAVGAILTAVLLTWFR